MSASLNKHRMQHKEMLRQAIEVLGATEAHVSNDTLRVFNDAATVMFVQQAIISLPQAKTDVDLQLGKPDGKLGPKTKRAVEKFNATYRNVPGDGEYITEGTLDALKLSPVTVPQTVRRGALDTPSVSVVSPVEEVPFFQRNVPGIERPLWQVLLGGAGGLAVIGGGAWLIFGGRR